MGAITHTTPASAKARRDKAAWEAAVQTVCAVQAAPAPDSLVEMDPALRRLLDNLPTGDPDAVPLRAAPRGPEQVEIRIPFCEGVHIVENGKPAQLQFGPWYGPVTRCADVVLHVRNLRTGVEQKFSPAGWLFPQVVPGETFDIYWHGAKV
jgi:hypothetical protein